MGLQGGLAIHEVGSWAPLQQLWNTHTYLFQLPLWPAYVPNVGVLAAPLAEVMVRFRAWIGRTGPWWGGRAKREPGMRWRHRVEVRQGLASARGEEGGGGGGRGGGAEPPSPSPPPSAPSAFRTWKRMRIWQCALIHWRRFLSVNSMKAQPCKTFTDLNIVVTCTLKSLLLEHTLYLSITLCCSLSLSLFGVIPPSAALSALSAPTSARCSRAQHLHYAQHDAKKHCGIAMGTYTACIDRTTLI